MTEPSHFRTAPSVATAELTDLSVAGPVSKLSWSGHHTAPDVAGRSWISAIRRYTAFVALGNLIWELAHLPLYTIWLTGTPAQLALAALHCTGGDILIGLSTLMAALAILGPTRWPSEGQFVVMVTTLLLGIGYTIFSEWLNIEVRHAWAYRAQMPVIPIINTGLSPLLQWLVIPVAASVWAWRRHSGALGAQRFADV